MVGRKYVAAKVGSLLIWGKTLSSRLCAVCHPLLKPNLVLFFWDMEDNVKNLQCFILHNIGKIHLSASEQVQGPGFIFLGPLPAILVSNLPGVPSATSCHINARNTFTFVSSSSTCCYNHLFISYLSILVCATANKNVAFSKIKWHILICICYFATKSAAICN